MFSEKKGPAGTPGAEEQERESVIQSNTETRGESSGFAAPKHDASGGAAGAERAERLAEIAGRFLADGYSQLEADRLAKLHLRAEQIAPKSLRDISETEHLRTWFVKPLFTVGLAIVAAKKGNWKSLFALQAAYSVAAGQSFLDHYVPQAHHTLYLALELDEIAIGERAEKIGEPPAGLDVLFNFPRGSDAIRDMEALLLSHGYRFIVVDMAAAILPHDTDGNAYDAVTGFLLQLRRLGQHYGACIVLLLHSPKAEKADFADAVLGSVGFGGQADSIVFLDRKRGHNVARVLATGNHGRDQAFKIKLDERTLRLSLADEGEDDAGASFLPPEEDNVLSALKRFPSGIGPTGLALAMNRPATEASTNAIRNTLSRLVDKGLASRPRRGVYVSTETMQDELTDLGGENAPESF